MLEGKIVKVRWVKNYASANNHVAVGRVEEETPNCLVVKCRTFHFGKLVRDRTRIRHGEVCVRAIPWSRIEVVHVLDGCDDWEADLKINKEGQLFLDNKQKTIIAKTTGRNLPEGEVRRRAVSERRAFI